MSLGAASFSKRFPAEQCATKSVHSRHNSNRVDWPCVCHLAHASCRTQPVSSIERERGSSRSPDCTISSDDNCAIPDVNVSRRFFRYSELSSGGLESLREDTFAGLTELNYL